LVVIEPMKSEHADQVLAIYQEGLNTRNASFETIAPDWSTWDSNHLAEHRFVAIDTHTGAVLGWVALSAVSSRCVYAGVVEESVYVHPAARGQGVGRRLLDAVIASSEQAGLWTIETGIFPENEASIALHRAAGFRVVGLRERVGKHYGQWRDVVFFERRSPAVS
jgi:L-amino acid N-acyltransferase YncA